MIDHSKRTTLKAIGATGVLGGLLASVPASASAITGVTSALPPAGSTENYGVSQLIIRIDARGAAEFTNLTSQPVSLQHFFPGSVHWDDNSLDLNTLRNIASRVLQSEESIVVPVNIRKNQSMNCTSDCLWADAAEPAGNRSQQVLLGAYHHQGLLHTYPIPKVIAAPFS
jgi:hypothetical protein